MQTTQDDLRAHFMEHPLLKTMDAYQIMLLLSAHSERHTAQIAEVRRPQATRRNSGAPAYFRTSFMMLSTYRLVSGNGGTPPN